MKTILQMNSVESFTTQRMIANRINHADFNDFYLTHSDERVAATLGGVVTEAVGKQKFAWNLQQWVENGFGLWIFRLKDPNSFIGRGGLRRVQVGGKEEIEVGYALMPEFWGLGLATEMAKASIEVAFDILQISNVVCFTSTTNLASKRVMEKAGFKYECDLMHAHSPHILYRLMR